MSNLNYVGNKSDFAAKSNHPWRNTFSYGKNIREEKRYCINHPTAKWGRDGLGRLYQQCAQGYRLKEKCEVGK